MPETHTLQGELIIGTIVHGAALNCMVVPYAAPEDWFFQQFVSQEAAETFAMEHQLVIKRKENE
jgi:hypothetical protein